MKRVFILLLALYQPVLTAKIKVPDLNYAQAWQSYAATAKAQRPAQIFPYHHCFEKSAKKHNLPISLLLAMAKGESDFNPNARSSANAYGLMQIVWPGTANYLGINSLKKLQKPCINVDAGARYIKELLNRYDGNIHLALAAYNYGPGRIGDGRIPNGANWYSGYIYHHLQYVLNRSQSHSDFKAPKHYSDEGKFEILVFNKPYRASAFMHSIKTRAPNVRLDTFDHGMGRYHVVLLYGSQKELQRAKKTLNSIGLAI